jgi:Na+-translocating membrane potential-generating system (MpsC)
VDDTAICILEGGFTIVERTPIEAGEEAAVHEIRQRFQAVMKSQFSGVVEEALGRKVRAYMRQVHTDPDIALELSCSSRRASRLSRSTSSRSPSSAAWFGATRGGYALCIGG